MVECPCEDKACPKVGERENGCGDQEKCQGMLNKAGQLKCSIVGASKSSV